MTMTLAGLSPAIWMGYFVASVGCLLWVLTMRNRLPRKTTVRGLVAAWLVLFIGLNAWYFSRALRAGGNAQNLPTLAQGVALLNFLSAGICYLWFWGSRRRTA